MNHGSPRLLVELQDITKSYKDVRAVSDLSFQLEPGKILGLLGHNGAGKTTTIRIILNLIIPDSGRISVIGQPVTPAVKDQIGYLPEERGLYKRMKVLELLVFFGSMKGMKSSSAKHEAIAWLKRLDLHDRRESKVDELSKGMQQKLQWIAAVMHQPPLLILDEPFTGLDPVNAILFEDIIRESRDRGCGILFSTHILEHADRFLDDVIMLKSGEAVVNGALSDVKARFGSDWIQVRGSGCYEVLSGMNEVSELSESSQAIRFRPADGITAREILEKLMSNDCMIREFSVVEPSLKEIFLHMVGGIEVEGLVDKEMSA